MRSSQIFMYKDPEIFQVHLYIKTLFRYMNEIMICDL